MKKQKYEPHRKLTTKVVPAETEYDRAHNREIIEELDAVEALHFGGDTGIDADFYNLEGELEDAQEMYENGFHIETPEN